MLAYLGPDPGTFTTAFAFIVVKQTKRPSCAVALAVTASTTTPSFIATHPYPMPPLNIPLPAFAIDPCRPYLDLVPVQLKVVALATMQHLQELLPGWRCLQRLPHRLEALPLVNCQSY